MTSLTYVDDSMILVVVLTFTQVKSLPLIHSEVTEAATSVQLAAATWQTRHRPIIRYHASVLLWTFRRVKTR